MRADAWLADALCDGIGCDRRVQKVFRLLDVGLSYAIDL